jgi:hypothetical protein
VGTVLRLAGLPRQILLDDELHAVRAALARPLREILVSYQVVDHCIPLTALYRLALDQGIPLSEALLRLPAVLAGLALLVAAPLWAARRFGWTVGVAFAWLLAISPGLVFYTRIARSYLPMVALGFLALVAFDRWWRRPGWRSGALFAVAAALAVWLHLGAAPLLVTPVLLAGVLALARRGRGLVPLLALGGGAALAMAALLLPAAESLAAMLRVKQGGPPPGWRQAGEVLQMQAGTPWAALAALVWLLAGLGVWVLARRDRRVAALATVAVLGQAIGILLLAPMGHELPLILHRYLLPGLPWVLLLAAVALGSAARWHRWAPALAGSALCAALLAAGPFAEPAWWRSSFTGHVDYVDFLHARPRLPEGGPPPFYRSLAAPGRGGPLAEHPFHPYSRLTRSLYLYQEAHGQDVLAAPAGGRLIDRRVRARNAVAPTPPALLASRARWVVVHRDLAVEERRLGASRVEQRYRALFRRSAATVAGRLRGAWGGPDFSDRTLWAWDLERVRGAARTQPVAERARAAPPDRGAGVHQSSPAPAASAASSTPARNPGGR